MLEPTPLDLPHRAAAPDREGETATSAAPGHPAAASRDPPVAAPAAAAEGAPTDILDTVDVLICGLDAEGRVVLFNRASERLTGVESRTAIGQRWLDLFVPEDRRPAATDLLRRVAEGQPVGPHESLCRSHRRIRWQLSPWRRGGGVSGVCAVGTDVTDEWTAEVRTRHAEHSAALGHLSAGLAHEIRNPLNGAALQLTVAERCLARAPEARTAPAAEAVGLAAREIRRAAALLDDFLEFARPEALEVLRVDLRAVARAAVERVRSAARDAGIDLGLETGAPILADVDPRRIEEALCGLLRNAIEAAAQDRSGGRVRLSLAVRGSAVAIEVEDNGPGLPSEGAPIFDPFFTTKPGGTGLGLAVVRRTATDHGGRIDVERRGEDTIFTLILPLPEGVEG